MTTINKNATVALIVHDFAISLNCPALKLICSLQILKSDLRKISKKKHKKKTHLGIGNHQSYVLFQSHCHSTATNPIYMRVT